MERRAGSPAVPSAWLMSSGLAALLALTRARLLAAAVPSAYGGPVLADAERPPRTPREPSPATWRGGSSSTFASKDMRKRTKGLAWRSSWDTMQSTNKSDGNTLSTKIALLSPSHNVKKHNYPLDLETCRTLCIVTKSRPHACYLIKSRDQLCLMILSP